MFGDLIGLAVVGSFIYVLDENGHRHRVRVRDEEHRRQLEEQNRRIRAKLAAKSPAKRVVKSVHKTKKLKNTFSGL